jgi:hypothetical protein
MSATLARAVCGNMLALSKQRELGAYKIFECSIVLHPFGYLANRTSYSLNLWSVNKLLTRINLRT